MVVGIWFAPEGTIVPYVTFLAATSVLFFVGLAEDLGWHVTPRTRLVAATVAGMLVVVLMGAWVPRIGPPALDVIMANGWLGIPITLFVVVGISNAFNLIDGVNGLAGVTGLACAIGLAFIAQKSGDDTMVLFANLIALSIIGFLALNWPFGWIFLGDAGAYTLGFVLSWFGVAIVIGSPDVTPWAVLLTMAWPVVDTLLAIYRRGARRASTMQPDRLHIHQMVMRTLEISVLGRQRRHYANPITTVILTPFVVFPVFLGVMLWDKPLAAFLSFVGLIALVFLGYFTMVRLVRSGVVKRCSQTQTG
jgi:UDP-N-acetylmuramyl pentapeptide phosphotransferase/UDP-N-acetylglucosamine-1-phosphate transferase